MYWENPPSRIDQYYAVHVGFMTPTSESRSGHYRELRSSLSPTNTTTTMSQSVNNPFMTTLNSLLGQITTIYMICNYIGCTYSDVTLGTDTHFVPLGSIWRPPQALVNFFFKPL